MQKVKEKELIKAAKKFTKILKSWNKRAKKKRYKLNMLLGYWT